MPFFLSSVFLLHVALACSNRSEPTTNAFSEISISLSIGKQQEKRKCPWNPESKSMKLWDIKGKIFFRRFCEAGKSSKFSPLNKQTFPHESFHVSKMNLLHVMVNILTQERETFTMPQFTWLHFSRSQMDVLQYFRINSSNKSWHK